MCVNVFVSERHRQTVTEPCHLIPPSSSALISASSSSSEQVPALFTLAADRLQCTELNLQLKRGFPKFTQSDFSQNETKHTLVMIVVNIMMKMMTFIRILCSNVDPKTVNSKLEFWKNPLLTFLVITVIDHRPVSSLSCESEVNSMSVR